MDATLEKNQSPNLPFEKVPLAVNAPTYKKGISPDLLPLWAGRRAR